MSKWSHEDDVHDVPSTRHVAMLEKFKDAPPKLGSELLTSLFDLAFKELAKLRAILDEMEKERFEAAIEPHIVGCTNLVSYAVYDVDEIVNEIEVEVRGCEPPPPPSVLNVIIGLIRTMLPSMIAREMCGILPSFSYPPAEANDLQRKVRGI